MVDGSVWILDLWMEGHSACSKAQTHVQRLISRDMLIRTIRKLGIFRFSATGNLGLHWIILSPIQSYQRCVLRRKAKAIICDLGDRNFMIACDDGAYAGDIETLYRWHDCVLNTTCQVSILYL